MQILPRMPLGRASFDEFRRVLDKYLSRIVEAVNHNVKEREITLSIHVVPAGYRRIHIPLVPYKIISVNAILWSGTCDIIIGNGAGVPVVWKAAASSTLSLTSALTTDTSESGSSIEANDLVTVYVYNLSYPVGLVITLRTGS